jgi:deoxyribose-phosphate aldolase
MSRWTREAVAELVDHTLLKPEATDVDVVFLTQEAAELEVYAVCVSPSLVAAARRSAAVGLSIATVVGFPSGKHVSAIKAQEARLAVAAGAQEVDMVIDVGAAVAGDFATIRADVAAVRAAVPDVVLKVIVESAVLLDLGAARPWTPTRTSSRPRRVFTPLAGPRYAPWNSWPRPSARPSA